MDTGSRLEDYTVKHWLHPLIYPSYEETDTGVTGKGCCLKFPTAVRLPVFGEDVKVAIPQPLQQGANRTMAHEMAVRDAPDKEQEPDLQVTNKSPTSRPMTRAR
jgi:hypothetical protein